MRLLGLAVFLFAVPTIGQEPVTFGASFDERPQTRLRAIPRAYAATPQTMPVEYAAQATCRVWAPSGGGVQSAGTGTYIGGKTVITAYHVIDELADGATAYVGFRGGDDRINVVGHLKNKNADQYVLELEREPKRATPVRIATGIPANGERVFGCGLGGDASLVVWSGTYREGQSVQAYVDNPNRRARQGDSGCGVFNSAGEYLGTFWGGPPVDEYGRSLGGELTFIDPAETQSFLRRTGFFEYAQREPSWFQPSGQWGTQAAAGQSQPCQPVNPPINPPINPRVDPRCVVCPPGPQGEPGPMGPAGPQGLTPNEQVIETIIRQIIDEDPERFRGERGLQGERGVPGQDGIAGIDGLTEDDIDKLADRLPPFTAAWVDQNNGVIKDEDGNPQRINVKLGGYLPLRLSERLLDNAR